MGELIDKITGKEEKEKSRENIREKMGPAGETVEEKQESKEEHGPRDPGSW